MPCRFANDSAFPRVGDATATTSASSGTAFTDAAMQSAWKRDPTIPTPTLVMSELGEKCRRATALDAERLQRIPDEHDFQAHLLRRHRAWRGDGVDGARPRARLRHEPAGAT